MPGDSNLIYEVSPHYASNSTAAQRETGFGELARHAAAEPERSAGISGEPATIQ
jgi:hypothetical protein